ncbi:MAG: hypothetical protein RL757_497 [Bacteroidota bacterium]|jgi:hypothetical protein
MKKKLLIIAFFAGINLTNAQSMLDGLDDAPTTEYAEYAFKTNRIINLHSIENTAHGVMDFKISHRFGTVDNGLYDLFGIDQATQRFGMDYGVTDNFQIGWNRNSVAKAYDGYLKYRILRQSTGKRNMPISLSAFAGMAIETSNWSDPTRTNYFSSRLIYSYQLLIARKFNDIFTLQLTPTMIHRNLAPAGEKSDVYALGVGGRIRLTRRITFNAEYIWNLPNQLQKTDGQLEAVKFDPLSVGVDIETGGHVFQLHFTNATSMSEYGFVTRTTDDFFKGKIRFGFNVSRVFTIFDPKKSKEKEKPYTEGMIIRTQTDDPQQEVIEKVEPAKEPVKTESKTVSNADEEAKAAAIEAKKQAKEEARLQAEAKRKAAAEEKTAVAKAKADEKAAAEEAKKKAKKRKNKYVD